MEERVRRPAARDSLRTVTMEAIAAPALRPGLRVFRRDDDHLQVGIDEPRVVLTDSPGVRRLLDDLVSGASLGSLSPDAGLALERLAGHGLVVERADLRPGSAAAEAVFARHGPEAPARLKARAACRVEVVAPEPWRRTVGDWLADAEIASPISGDLGPPHVTLLVSRDEVRRSQVDPLVRADRPHLLVALLPDRVRLGPFVVPGVTACLRCVDAHLGEQDPRRALVLEQLEDAEPAPTPYDPVLAHAALALAVRELTSYAEGDRPATWSATLTLAADLALPRQAWTRHPHCGCAWA